ncbi:MAG: CotH kinase family protein [Bacteroidales bacterium]|nr:CotH kinase family protein [Bacteroidales bacterium]MBQ6770305.1 CotH kinase family protein [Bacteroidales bacterium]
MMNVKKIIFTVFLSLLCAIIQAQILTDSNLPIVVIETDGGVPIPDEPRVMGTMKIIWHQDGSRNYLSDINNPAYLNYDGRISIEVRGSTSQQFFDKKPYGLTTLQADNVTNNNVSLLGMPKENDWILNSLAFDQTGLRDVLSYELFERLGQYAVRRVYCEVMVNGDYKGLYVFMEKIKVDDDRVNIAKMDDSCNNYPEVSGGYITKADKPNGDPVAWSMEEYGYGWWPYYTDFIHHYPKPENVTLAQNNYIHGVFTNLATVANRHDTSISTGIPSVIDIPSFVDFMLVAEYSSNVDVYSLSTFFHKDRNGKLRAGPVWDYNLTYGYDAFGSRSRYDVWQFNNQDNNGPKFWRDLFNTDLYRCYLARRWFEQTAPGMPLSYEFVCNRMDEIEALITEAIGRDNQRWHNMTQHEQWMGDMKNWIQLRINWLNQNIGPYEGCADVDLPPLVISKIHYHPQDYWDIDGDRLEFIEITNNGDEEVDLTGVYFRELGVTFSFPDHAQVGGHEALVLCSDSLAFRDYYNTLPFGQFTRNLSNKSENLVLADAWGNVIDEVHYYDSAPWPWEADGDGPYLELIDLNLDNSLPESWTVGYDLTGLDDRHEAAMGLYPNPTRDVLHVDLAETAVRCQLIAVTGNVVQETSAVAQHYDLDLSPLPSGLFVVKVQLENGKTVFRKVVKQ